MRTPRDFRKEMIMLKIFMFALFTGGIVGMYFLSLGHADSRHFLGLNLKIFSPTIAAIAFAILALDEYGDTFQAATLIILLALFIIYVGGVGTLTGVMFVVIMLSVAINTSFFKSDLHASLMIVCIAMATISSVLLTDFLISICVPLAVFGLKRTVPEFIKM